MTPALPEYSTDATGVITGNADIGTPEWNPPQCEPERPVLPGCEHEPNLPKAWPWLTERRMFRACWWIGGAGIALALLRWEVAAGLLAVAVLALCALLPMLGHMRSVMRNKTTEEVRASQEAKLAAAILAFDDLNDYASRIHGRMYADGILPDRRLTKRENAK